MSIPTPRFTGVFIPVEILEHPNLTLLEQMLLSWIDALYCKDHKGCFAKNEYFAARLKVKENTIAKALTSLRKKNLIEDVSFDGRNRVIRSKTGAYVDQCQSKSGLDLNPNQGWKKIQPWNGKKSNPLYIDYSKEERKEENITSNSSSPSSCSSPEAQNVASLFLETLKKVKPDIRLPKLEKCIKTFDRMIRLDKRSPDSIKKIIEWLPTNEFWFKNILSPEKLREQFDRLQMESSKVPSGSSAGNNKFFETLKNVLDFPKYASTVQFGKDYVEFPGGQKPPTFSVADKDFKEKVMNQLKKMGFNFKLLETAQKSR